MSTTDPGRSMVQSVTDMDEILDTIEALRGKEYAQMVVAINNLKAVTYVGARDYPEPLLTFTQTSMLITIRVLCKLGGWDENEFLRDVNMLSRKSLIGSLDDEHCAFTLMDPRRVSDK